MRRLARWLAVGIALVGAIAAWAHWSGRRAAVDHVAEAGRLLGLDLRAGLVSVNGIRLHVVEAGPATGPPVLLLHGFPEFWWGWKAQMARLANAGFRVVVPDQRGYNVSDKPDEVEAYRVSTLVADVVGLIDALGMTQVNLGAHDWGGAVAWRVALAHPERVRRLAMFNSAHPGAWVELESRPSRSESVSWYRTFFQLPWLPELAMRANDWSMISRNLVDTSRPGTFDDRELAYYKAAWARDGAISSMVDWYRAAFRYPEPLEGDGVVRTPTLILWGLKDPFFPTEMAALSAARCANGRLVTLPDAGHWLLHEEPDVTSRAMIDFFRET
jgi:pimeloyl-ACP methyl ester carboxylesterase